MHTNRLQNETNVVWITGAGSGIGKDIAIALASQGKTVIASGRSYKKLQALAQQFPNHIYPIAFDVSRSEDVAEMTSSIERISSHLDCVILSAGICHYVNANDLKVETFRKDMDTNFFGMINSFNAALPLLKRATRRPHLLGISSMAAYVGLPRAESYGASKAAVTYLLNSLRADCGHWLDITVVNPGFVKTPLTASNDFPMPFLISSETAAMKVVAALESRPRRLQFPLRLHWALRVAQCFPSLWYSTIVPRLSRQRG